MSRIRRVEIHHFRGIEHLVWNPSPGVNCLIGPGDVGKSTVLDAIDYCLGSRRTLQPSDADFHGVDAGKPVRIQVTIGDLEDPLMSLDAYGLYLRGFDAESGEIDDEPEAGRETVLTIELVIEGDLEPSWALHSERAEAQGQSRHLNWADRLKLSPTRLGAFSDYHLGWRKGSILNRVSDERADASAELARFAREARETFGETAKEQVPETLALVKKTAAELGIPVGEVTAMLDAQSVSLSGGMISLHAGDGVPLRGLGLGSVRLLVAGLQRAASGKSAVVLVDEVEHGLEPHRICRLLHSLGAKEANAPIQAFMTTHSPVVLRELSSDQLFVLRRTGNGHEARQVGAEDAMQGTVRACPEALLAPCVIVGEGPSEIGLVRGLDLYRVENGQPSIAALGASLADGQGDNTFRRANALLKLGYRVLVLRDSDKPLPAEAKAFATDGGKTASWRDGLAVEQELFQNLPEGAVLELLDVAVERKGEVLIDDHIKSASAGTLDLASCRVDVNDDVRAVLGKAAKSKSGAWFKTVTEMEAIGRGVVGPNLDNATAEFRGVVDFLFTWAQGDQ